MVVLRSCINSDARLCLSCSGVVCGFASSATGVNIIVGARAPACIRVGGRRMVWGSDLSPTVIVFSINNAAITLPQSSPIALSFESSCLLPAPTQFDVGPSFSYFWIRTAAKMEPEKEGQQTKHQSHELPPAESLQTHAKYPNEVVDQPSGIWRWPGVQRWMDGLLRNPVRHLPRSRAV